MNLIQPDKEHGPDLDSVGVLDADGHRKYVFPADVKGRFRSLKRWVYVPLIALFVGLPWIDIGGQQAVLIDIPMRRFYFFGATFNAQDFYLAFFILTGIGFALIALSALWGRVWCGWACPQTVFLDGVFRRIERWIEGPAHKRRKLADRAMDLDKLWRKSLKHLIYFAVAFAIAHCFMMYFAGRDELLHMMTQAPGDNWGTFVWSAAMTGVFYFNFWWFREQLCIVICPYGRLQSALQDDDTVVIGYDERRGEPRGKAKDPNAADCVDCKRCIQVCPTGIDIRNGLQLECIGCAYCIDACDEIMGKLGRDPGLIRYDSKHGFDGNRKRFWRPRVFVYIVAGLVGLTVATFVMSAHEAFEANLVRVHGVPYVIDKSDAGAVTIRNQFNMHLVNKNPGASTLTIAPIEEHGFSFIVSQNAITLESFQDRKVPIVVTQPKGDYAPGRRVRFEVSDSASGTTRVMTLKFVGPAG